MKHLRVFRNAALALAGATKEYCEIHREFGISSEDWELVTQDDIWNAEQRSRAKGILQEVLNVSLTVAQLPPTPLPAEYVAAVIATVCSPCNWTIAAHTAGQAYDVAKMSGLYGIQETSYVTPEQLFSLVLAFQDPSFDDIRSSVNELPRVDTRQKLKEASV